MIRRLALAAGLTVLSAVGFASSASAAPANQDVNFTGNIGSVCTFTGKTDGTLLQQSPGNQWVEGANGVPGFTNGGTAGAVTLNCSNGGLLSVAVPVSVAAPPTFTPAKIQSLVSDGTNFTSANTGGNFDTGIWAKPTTPLTIPTGTNVNLKVGMVAGANGTTGGVPSGTYTYKVTLTATPN
jgi:hypothetical protein